MNKITLNLLSSITLIGTTLPYLSYAETDTTPTKTKSSNQELDTIIVTDPLAGTLEEIVRPSQVLSGDELLTKAASTLGETLAGELGVSSSSFGPGVGRPVIRGLSADRVRILQDGTGTLDISSTSPDHAVSSEAILADQIEILKGPAALLYGSSAVGGVVNVIDGRVPSELPNTLIQGAFEYRHNSASDSDTEVIRLDGAIGQWAWHIDGFDRDTNDLEIEGLAQVIPLDDAVAGNLENSKLKADQTTFGLSYIADQGFIGLSFSELNNVYGVPPGVEEEEENDAHSLEEESGIHIDIDQKRYDLKAGYLNPLPGFTELKFRFSLNEYQQLELEGDEIGTVFDNDAYETRLDLIHAPISGWRGVIGAQFLDRDFQAQGEEAFVPDSDIKSLGVFIVERKTIDQFNIELGLRFENKEIDSIEPGQNTYDDNGFSASASLLWNVNSDYSVGVSFSSTERLPEVTELFSNGAHLATRAFEIGDPGLKSERSNNIDISFRKKNGALKGTFNLFYNNINNFIIERMTGEIRDGLDVFEFRQQDALFRGAEFELDYQFQQLGWDFSTGLRADLVRAKFTGNNGGDVPRIPPLSFGVELSAKRNNFASQLEVIRYTEQDDIDDFEIITRPYTMVNLSATYRFGFANNADYVFFIRGSNLLDEQIRNASSFLKDIAPEAGRSIMAGIRIGF